MTTTDANGIVFLEETDPIAPFHTLINTLQTATSQAVALTSTGSFTTSSPWAVFQNSVSRLNKLVVWNFRLDRTGAAGASDEVVGTLPVGFRPSVTIYAPVGVVTGGFNRVGLVIINTAGQVTLSMNGQTGVTTVAGTVSFRVP